MEEWLLSRSHEQDVANALQTRRDAGRRDAVAKKRRGIRLILTALFVPFLAAFLQFFIFFFFLVSRCSGSSLSKVKSTRDVASRMRNSG